MFQTLKKMELFQTLKKKEAANKIGYKCKVIEKLINDIVSNDTMTTSQYFVKNQKIQLLLTEINEIQMLLLKIF